MGSDPTQCTAIGKRALIGMLLAIVACAVPGGSLGREPRTLYIAPSPAGTGDGSDWRNAGSLERLSAFIAMAGPGGTVMLRADDGPYIISREISVRAGGNDRAPVTITGADSAGRPAKAEIVGSRSDPWTPDGKAGSDVFRLYTGANNLRFEHILFRNQGNGCFRIANDVRGLELQDIDARNVQRFVENYASGSAKGASIDGLTIRRVTVRGYSKGAIRLRGNSRSILIEDVIGDSERQDGDNFAEGIALEGMVHDAVIRRVTMMNSHDSTHEYWNGDGFVTEREVSNVLFEDTVASGSTDAGYDLKSSATTLLRSRAEDNKRNFKIWGNVVVVDCVSRNPHKRGGTGPQSHFWFGTGAEARVSGCQVDDSHPDTIAFEVEQDARVVIQNPTITINPSARMSHINDGGSLDITTTR
jgi:hypothetical protein